MSIAASLTQTQTLAQKPKAPAAYRGERPRWPQSVDGVCEAERLQFDCQGFIILRGVLDAETVQRYKEELARLESLEYDDSHRPDKSIGMPVKSEFAEALRLNGLPRISSIFDEVIAHETVLPYLDEFVADPMLVNTWSINKMQGKGSVGWHSGLDAHGHYVNGTRSFTQMLNMIWALDENNMETGCPIVLPGSHKRCFNPTEHIPLLERPGSIPVILDPGDVLIFSEATLHGGLPRSVPGSRRNLYINYIEGSRGISYDSGNLHNYWFPPEVRARFPQEKQRFFRWMETCIGA